MYPNVNNAPSRYVLGCPFISGTHGFRSFGQVVWAVRSDFKADPSIHCSLQGRCSGVPDPLRHTGAYSIMRMLSFYELIPACLQQLDPSDGSPGESVRQLWIIPSGVVEC